MSRDSDLIFDAIARWEQGLLLDRTTADKLRGEVAAHSKESTSRLSQYVLAFTGAVVLVIAGGVFLDWAWPLIGPRGRTSILGAAGLGVLFGGVQFENQRRWRPAAYLMQTAGLLLVLGAYLYSKEVWEDQTLMGSVIGILALATPIVLAPRSMRRNVVMPAVHMTIGLAFLAVFLDRSTPLSADASIWVLDAVLAVAILGLVGLIRNDPDGHQHPWALNAFVASMAVGFILVSITAWGPLSLGDEGLFALDVWLLLCAALTLWGVHRAPPGLQRGWFESLLAYEMFAWIILGLVTAFEPLDGPPELGLLMVGGVGVLAFIHADRHRIQQLMAAASLAFIVPVWWWAVDRGGALGGVAALVATAGFLFWASGRRGRYAEAETQTTAE